MSRIVVQILAEKPRKRMAVTTFRWWRRASTVLLFEAPGTWSPEWLNEETGERVCTIDAVRWWNLGMLLRDEHKPPTVAVNVVSEVAADALADTETLRRALRLGDRPLRIPPKPTPSPAPPAPHSFRRF